MYRVIIVEDEGTVRKGIVTTTNWAALDCVIVGEASNGEEGRELTMRLAPDIVITDVKMPFMDGVEMIRKLKEAGCKSEFIILTAYSDFKYAQSALRLGVKDYLLKPMQEGNLEAAIQNILNLSKPAEVSYDSSDLSSVIPPLIKGKDASNKYVSEAISFIYEHYNEDITITTVARSLDISEGYLSRIFKKETGHTFTNYLIFYRTRLAMNLLKNHRVKIYEVADSVGYSDTTYFSSQFKKIVGMSPSEYQEHC
ncbi:response regulator [Lachnospiraceae bacterium OttesenSCG-928-D06]|nr:response regulator [Lachnospiraceae bacterium OttesenSCG-928-D06]